MFSGTLLQELIGNGLVLVLQKELLKLVAGLQSLLRCGNCHLNIMLLRKNGKISQLLSSL
jgi:hypothetical protein